MVWIRTAFQKQGDEPQGMVVQHLFLPSESHQGLFEGHRIQVSFIHGDIGDVSRQSVDFNEPESSGLKVQ